MRTTYALILLCIVACLLLTGGASFYSLQTPDKGNIMVYGSPTCPWCVKQTDYLTQKGIPFDFIDCSSKSCPDFVSGYPTILRDGQIMNGYTEL